LKWGPFHRPGWVLEEKADGGRGLAYKDAGGGRLIRLNGRDLTLRFAEISPPWGAGLYPSRHKPQDRMPVLRNRGFPN
jgi:hypothetical protein